MMPWGFLVLGLALFAAYANGANDNFKGVATLFGSKTASYRLSLFLGTACTFAGSLAAFLLASKLIGAFSGRGLVPDALTREPAFAASVILGAAVVVLAAARLGMPISTTHALTGSLAGSGFMVVGGSLDIGALAGSFLAPLALTPVLAAGLTAVFYGVSRGLAARVGFGATTCVCVVKEELAGELAFSPAGRGPVLASRAHDVLVAEQAVCDARSREVQAGVGVGKLMNVSHAVSAGAVSFARGLNDTPKIVGLAALVGGLGTPAIVWGVGLAMALGGLTGTRRVAETMSRRITTMDRGQGLAANLITAFLVFAASRWGLPVSTTHVSCGALFGIGLTGGRADWRTVRSIAAAWLLTLPASAVLSGACYFLLQLL